MKVGSRAVVFNLRGEEAYRGEVVAVNVDEAAHADAEGGCHCTVTVRDDELGEDHEVIAALVAEAEAEE